MSDMAKAARAAMKAKAKKITTANDPSEKVSSTTWTPPEPLNADVKTGLRPVSRRAFKTGGKVMGVKAKANMGQKPRAKKDTGGGLRSESTQYEKAKRNAVDEASDYGMDSAHNMDSLRKATRNFEQTAKETGYSNRKSGGRTKKEYGGPMAGASKMIQDSIQQAGVPTDRMSFGKVQKGSLSPARGVGLKKGGAAHEDVKEDKALIRKMVKPSARTKKEDGGSASLDSMNGLKPNQPKRVFDFQHELPSPEEAKRAIHRQYPGWATGDKKMQSLASSELKKGGRIKKEGGGGMPKKGSADDIERGLARNMLARSMAESKLRDARLDNLTDLSDNMGQARYTEPHDFPKLIYPGAGMKKGGRSKRATGGGVFSGPGYPGKVPGATGGRTAHAAGGKAGKGKTDIKIVIAAGKPAGAGDMMPGGPTPPPAKPVPVPPPAGAPPAGMPMQMPPMPPQAGAGGPPGGMLPMPRKAGGRTYRSYKDMDAGVGSGEGRLEKTEIANRAMHNKGGKVGHRNYRNYKDMDAGAASGLGRLEKTEMARKKTGIQLA
jgi:hypothetical protein